MQRLVSDHKPLNGGVDSSMFEEILMPYNGTMNSHNFTAKNKLYPQSHRETRLQQHLKSAATLKLFQTFTRTSRKPAASPRSTTA